MSDLGLFLQAIVNGFLIGALYSLAAAGMALVWGVMDIVNLAHGALLILASYLAYWSFYLYGLNPLLFLPLSVVIGFAIGMVMYKGLVKRVIYSPPLISLLMLFGLGISLTNLMLNIWRADDRGITWITKTFSIEGIYVPLGRAIAAGIAVILMILLYAILHYTHFGKAVRGVAMNKLAAQLAGMDIDRIYAISMGIGISYAMVAGSLLAMVNPFNPHSGEAYLAYSFAVVVLGGLKNPIGVLYAGLFIGIIESLIGTYISMGISPAVAFLSVILVLTLRANRLLGR